MSQSSNSGMSQAVVLAQRIVEAIMDADKDVQRRALRAAFAIVADENEPVTEGDAKLPDHANDKGKGTLMSLLERGENRKPAENVYLCVAQHYSTYGNTPFSIQDLKEIATEAGLVLPDRLDMTLKGAAHKKRKMFQAAGSGSWRLTATGATVISEKWDVRPGRAAKVA